MKKNKPKKNRTLKIVIGFLISLTIVSAALYIVPTIMSEQRSNNMASDSRENITVAVNEENTNPNLLYTSENSENLTVFSLRKNIITLTSNDAVSINKNGKVTDTSLIDYTKPVVKYSENKYIIFERTTGKFTILNKNGKTFSKDGGKEIINCDIASNGRYAVITRENPTQYNVSVYTPSNRELFMWSCSDCYLTDVALSPKGNSLILSTVGVDDTEKYGKLLYFTVKSKDIEKTIPFSSSSIYDVKYINEKSIGVVTDLSYKIINLTDDSEKNYSFSYDTLTGFRFSSNGKIAVKKTEFGSLSGSVISVIDKNAEEITQIKIEDTVSDYCFNGKCVYVLFSGKINVYSASSGSMIKTVDTISGLKKIACYNNDVIAVDDTGTYLYQCK